MTGSKKHIKKILFPLFALSIPILALVIIEITLRAANYGNDYTLFAPSTSKGYEEYLKVNPEIGKKYFNQFHYTTPANDIFTKQKQENTFRIFVMGSSTVYGFPFDKNLMFSRILHQRLKQAYPNKNIEVVNTAISAINSYTLLDFTEQIIEQSPDAVLIYAGHNEFYGAYGIGSNETMSSFRFLTLLHMNLSDVKLYQLLQNIIYKLVPKQQITNKGERTTLMKAIVGNKNIKLKDKEYGLAMRHYAKNMNSILNTFNKNNIPVFLSEVVCNDRDLKPFSSNSASSIDSTLIHFNKANKLYRKQDYLRAKQQYQLARNTDEVRFRASTELNAIVNELAKKHHIKLVNTIEHFEQNAENGIIGDDLMIDHVHPNINGQFIMADGFYNKIVESKLIDSKAISTSLKEFKANYGYTKLDSLVATHEIDKLKSYWPFVGINTKTLNEKQGYSLPNQIDSIAFLVSNNKNIKLTDARLKLARHFEENKDYQNAFNEYNALICTDPYLAINYTDAAQCLIKLNKYNKAIQYCEQSLNYNKSSQILFKLGQLHLICNNSKTAVHYFNQVITNTTNNDISKYSKTFKMLLESGKQDYAKEVALELVHIN